MEPKSKENIAKLMEKALKATEPVVFKDKSCFLKSLTYQDDMILSSLVQDVCLEAAAAGMESSVLNRAASIAVVLGTVKLSLHDVETGLLVFPTMADINETTKGDIQAYLSIQKIFDIYEETLELTKAEKKS